MYSVYQHWDPLRVCIVGRSYPPEFYNFVQNSRVRTVLERIAHETEQDYQKLIQLLEKFDVQVLRPEINPDLDFYLTINGSYQPPPMTPRDYSIMLGSDFYFKNSPNPLDTNCDYNPDCYSTIDQYTWLPVLNQIQDNAQVFNQRPTVKNYFNSASVTRIGRDIYVGTDYYQEDISQTTLNLQTLYPQYRWHRIDTGGHSDGTYCPVTPGLIISLRDVPTYSETFPDWEVVYLPNQSWDRVENFLKIKQKNHGRWWVPGEELNDEFTDFVESWLTHWVGYVEETVFDVNMLVIDKHNVIVNNYNQQVFDALARYNVTPHVINFRHRYFWDGGLHCITSDVHREGTMQDYFPNRG